LVNSIYRNPKLRYYYSELFKKYKGNIDYKEKIIEGRKDFYAWFDEHDRRRNTDFKKTFLEMHNFYQTCKDLKNG
jgi:hypothetical protein